MILWVLAPCRCQRFAETYNLHLLDETVCFSEISASTNESTLHQNSDHHRRDNLKPTKNIWLSIRGDKMFATFWWAKFLEIDLLEENKYMVKYH